MKKKALILSLIKDNLINTRLVLGLKDMNLSDAGHYHLHLSDTILKLMGVEVKDSQYEKYLNLFNQVKRVDIVSQPEKLDRLAEQIYRTIKRKTQWDGW